MNVLQGVDGIRFQMFNEHDVVRHHLVQRIIRAYEDFRSRDDRQLSLELGAEAPRPAPELAPLEEKQSEPVPVRQ